MDSQLDGPMIIACNHSNSFLDAIIISTFFKQPVHFLVRGDVFKPGIIGRFMAAIKMIPIYRIREGREQLKKNDDTFELCREILNKNGVILIFSEGVCINEWNLRPLGKGTARIVRIAIKESGNAAHVKILPLGINYDRFKGPLTHVWIQSNGLFDPLDLPANTSEAQWLNDFNETLTQRLRPLVMSKEQIDLKAKPSSKAFKWICLGLHLCYYPFIKKVAEKKTSGTVFFDSILYGLLMLTYPIFLGLLWGVFSLFIPTPFDFVLMAIWPLSAFLASKLS